MNVGSAQEVLGDAAREAFQGKDCLKWHQLSKSERERWTQVGEAILKRLWVLDKTGR